MPVHSAVRGTTLLSGAGAEVATTRYLKRTRTRPRPLPTAAAKADNDGGAAEPVYGTDANDGATAVAEGSTSTGGAAMAANAENAHENNTETRNSNEKWVERVIEYLHDHI